MTAGVVALVAALVVAVAGGGIWRRTNGRMRNALPAAVQAPAGPAVPLSTFAAADAAPQGHAAEPSEAARPPHAGVPPETALAAGPSGTGLRLSSDDIRHPLGERATLLQFSTAFCSPCRATRRILADVAGMTEGIAHVEIDAESRLDLVRQLNVLRTPTVLVLAGDGTIVRRASGQPRKPDVIAAIGAAVDYNSHINDRD
jgi:thiol-disulfide isomerase/thioredoxin